MRFAFIYSSKQSSSDFLDVFFDFLLFLKSVLLLAQDDPVVLVVILVAVALEKIFEHVPHSCVLRSFVESQVSALAEILHELNRVALAQNLNGSCQLLFFDPFVLVPLVVGLESLPRKHTSQEVHGNVTDTFHIISAGLLNTQVSVDGSISGSSGQIFTLSVRDVFAISLDVPLGESKVEQEHFMAGFVVTHAEVIGFDISVDEVPVVDVLDSGDHLIDEHQDCLQGELSEGVFKK